MDTTHGHAFKFMHAVMQLYITVHNIGNSIVSRGIQIPGVIFQNCP